MQVERAESRWCDDEGKEKAKRSMNLDCFFVLFFKNHVPSLQLLQDALSGGVHELGATWYSSTHTASYKGETALLLT